MNSTHQRKPQSGRGLVFTWGSDNDTGALGMERRIAKDTAPYPCQSQGWLTAWLSLLDSICPEQ